MNRICRMLAVVALVLALCAGLCAQAETISTTVVMRVSKMTQNAVVNAGEDLSMEINIDGVNPASYQWYFENEAIPGANQKAYSIVNAKVENSGLYRMDAFDADGRMLVSMDISARVIDKSIPQSGDSSLPLGVVAGVFALAAGTLVLTLRRKECA